MESQKEPILGPEALRFARERTRPKARIYDAKKMSQWVGRRHTGADSRAYVDSYTHMPALQLSRACDVVFLKRTSIGCLEETRGAGC